MKLAKKKKRWKLVVQIYMEGQNECKKALDVIRQNMTNLKDKVLMLQKYGPQFLSESKSQLDQITEYLKKED